LNLVDLLFGFNKIKFNEIQNHNLDSLFTKIKYDGNKTLNITFTDKKSITTCFTIKVKNKGNYLSIKRKTFLIPIPFLFFIHKSRKAIIFNDINGDLHIVNGETQTIWILMAAGNSFTHENIFKLVK
jgi:hypothetical protein